MIKYVSAYTYVSQFNFVLNLIHKITRCWNIEIRGTFLWNFEPYPLCPYVCSQSSEEPRCEPNLFAKCLPPSVLAENTKVALSFRCQNEFYHPSFQCQRRFSAKLSQRVIKIFSKAIVSRRLRWRGARLIVMPRIVMTMNNFHNLTKIAAIRS